MTPPLHLADTAPLIVGLASLGFVVAFILKKVVLRTLNLIDPLLLRLKLPIEIGVALMVPGIIAIFFDGNVVSTVLYFNFGYAFGTYILDI